MKLTDLEANFLADLKNVEFNQIELNPKLKELQDLQILLQKEVLTLNKTSLNTHQQNILKKLKEVDEELFSNSEYRLYLSEISRKEQIANLIDLKIQQLKE